MKFKIRSGHAFRSWAPTAVLPAFLLSACLGAPDGEVKDHWGEAYAKTMKAQIPETKAEKGKTPSYSAQSGEINAVTSDLILENYQADVKRTPADERETFIIDTGLN